MIKSLYILNFKYEATELAPSKNRYPTRSLHNPDAKNGDTKQSGKKIDKKDEKDDWMRE